MSKRKAYTHRDNGGQPKFTTTPSDPDPALFIQAHEADIIRGPRGHAASLALEVRRIDGQQVVGEGLIKWDAGNVVAGGEGDDEYDATRQKETPAIWVDRYDARLLLDAWQVPPSVPSSQRMSPTGWSDLPSDAEDTFFLSLDEVEDYHRDKRRRMIEKGRQERLKAMQAEEGEGETREEDNWGGSDEEPDDGQKELMRRTAQHILSSPNPAQLEMRILANHGADKRFAFLRGRWSRAWKTAKGRIRVEQEEERRKNQMASSAGLGLSGYSDSDEESGPEDKPERREDGSPDKIEGQQQVSVDGDQVKPDSTAQDDAVKAARRAKAREWAENRRAQHKNGTPPRSS